MSASGYDGSPGTLDVEISGLDGKQFQLTLRDDLLGSEVLDLVAARLPRRRGCTLKMIWKDEELVEKQTLSEQGDTLARGGQEVVQTSIEM